MPEISRFHGIMITMYHEFGRHQQPHFHARHAEYKASFTIVPPALLAGTLLRREHNLVVAWAELHQQELPNNWRPAEQEQPLERIERLR